MLISWIKGSENSTHDPVLIFANALNTFQNTAMRVRISEKCFALVITADSKDLIHARIERAKQLLLHTNLQIQEIAYQCGYQNGNHFMRQFKEHTGETAKNYRINHQI